MLGSHRIPAGPAVEQAALAQRTPWLKLGLLKTLTTLTLPETIMETQKGLYKDYSPFKRGLYGFPC